jgi:magnesium-transporting ATPase (P-type)
MVVNILDDNFATIVQAVKEGRRIYANIHKFVIHLMAGNIAEAIVLVVAIVIGFNPPLSSIQILWLNMVTNTPPAMALGLEPAPSKIMDQKYRPVTARIFTLGTIIDISYYGSLMGGICLLVFYLMHYPLEQSLSHAQVTTYVTLTMLLMVHAYNCRDQYDPFWTHGVIWRVWLHGSLVLGYVALLVTLVIPFVREDIFRQTSIQWIGWVFVVGGIVAFLGLSEVYKFGRRRIRARKFKAKTKRINE